MRSRSGPGATALRARTEQNAGAVTAELFAGAALCRPAVFAAALRPGAALRRPAVFAAVLRRPGAAQCVAVKRLHRTDEWPGVGERRSTATQCLAAKRVGAATGRPVDRAATAFHASTTNFPYQASAVGPEDCLARSV